MSAPTLEVLALQAEHLRQQADMLRQHLDAHLATTDGMAWLHIETAIAHCRSINLLASHVRSGCTCAIEAQKPLPVCAKDKSAPVKVTGAELKALVDTGEALDKLQLRDPKPDSGDDPRWQGPEHDKYEANDRRGA